MYPVLVAVWHVFVRPMISEQKACHEYCSVIYMARHSIRKAGVHFPVGRTLLREVLYVRITAYDATRELFIARSPSLSPQAMLTPTHITYCTHPHAT